MTTHIQPGVWGVLATPFTSSTLEVDTTSLARVADHATAVGEVGLTVLGVFGEASRLSWAERKQVLETVLDSTTLPLVVGCTGLSSAPVIDEARMAAEVVGDRLAGIMVQANSPDRGILTTHLHAVHDSVRVPIVLQDYPVASGVRITASTLAEVATLPFIAAVKAESPPTAVTVAEVAARCEAPVFGGLGGLNLLDELAAGAAGAMTGFSYPEALVACVSAWSDGTPAKSRSELLDYLPLITFEQQPEVALAIRKECLRRRGLIAGSAVRPPARPVPKPLMPLLAAHIDLLEAGR